MVTPSSRAGQTLAPASLDISDSWQTTSPSCFHLSVQVPENSGPRLQNSYPPPAPARPNSWLTFQLLEQDSAVPSLGRELASLRGAGGGHVKLCDAHLQPSTWW